MIHTLLNMLKFSARYSMYLFSLTVLVAVERGGVGKLAKLPSVTIVFGRGQVKGERQTTGPVRVRT